MQTSTNGWILRIYWEDGKRCMPTRWQDAKLLNAHIARLIEKGVKFEVEARQ